MMPLHIFICAIVCLSSALTIAVDVQEMDNQILVTGEVTLPDCKLKEYSRWDKLMTMLENTHMRQNMLLQYVEELKWELQTVREDLQVNRTGSCSDCLKSITTDISSLLVSKCPPDNSLTTAMERWSALNWQIAAKIENIETLLKKKEEKAEKESECRNKGQNNADFTEKFNQVLEYLQRKEYETEQRHLPSGCGAGILFPMRSPKIYASVHPSKVSLHAFTFCVWTKVTEALEKTIVFSYGTKHNPYEMQLYLNRNSPVLLVGGDKNKIFANNTFLPEKWSQLCGTWDSDDGKTTLWVNGEIKTVTYELAQGHVIPDRGIFQLGQEKNGCCVGGGFDESLSFSGKITGFNLWDSVLSDNDIVNTAGEFGCNVRGNIIGWGTTEIQAHGGALYVH